MTKRYDESSKEEFFSLYGNARVKLLHYYMGLFTFEGKTSDGESVIAYVRIDNVSDPDLLITAGSYVELNDLAIRNALVIGPTGLMVARYRSWVSDGEG